MNKLLQFFREQIKEIEIERSLSLYGFFLVLIHAWNYVRWSNGSSFLEKVPFCWTFYIDCEPGRSWFVQNLTFVYLIYLVVILIVALLFLLRKNMTWAYIGLWVLTIYRIVLTYHDYRFMGNYHYMANIASLVFLLIPHKVFFLKLFLVAFYLGAGLLRFNTDWLSGSLILSKTFFTGKMLEFAMIYVIVLELCISLLLLSKKPAYFWFAMLQFIFFHAYSYVEVGWVFPIIMANLLSLFILEKIYAPTYLSSLSTKWGYSALALFVVAQLYPLVRYPQSAVTGEGRLISLNMFDAKTECYNRVQYKYRNQMVEKSIPKPEGGFRIGCDPLVYYNFVKYYCKDARQENDFIDMDIALIVKRTTDVQWTQTLNLQNVCSNPPQISFLGEFQQSPPRDNK